MRRQNRRRSSTFTDLDDEEDDDDEDGSPTTHDRFSRRGSRLSRSGKSMITASESNFGEEDEDDDETASKSRWGNKTARSSRSRGSRSPSKSPSRSLSKSPTRRLATVLFPLLLSPFLYCSMSDRQPCSLTLLPLLL